MNPTTTPQAPPLVAVPSSDLLDLPTLRRRWRDAHTYRVLCSIPHRADRTIRDGLSWERATALAEALQARHNLRHPKRTSWTRRLYSHGLSNRQISEPRQMPADGK